MLYDNGKKYDYFKIEIPKYLLICNTIVFPEYYYRWLYGNYNSKNNSHVDS
jgi:hypothetical protein